MNTKSNIISLKQALFPLIILIILLAYNVYLYGDSAMNGSNQFILIVGASIATIIGIKNGILFKSMLEAISSNIKSITGAILILLFVGALSGTWLISGIIPSMIFYGLKIINPTLQK